METNESKPPEKDPVYEGVECPVPLDELERRGREDGWLTTEELLERLERRLRS